MSAKNKTIIWVIVVVVILTGLFWWGRNNQETQARTWGETEIRCLPSGHQNLNQHIHPRLKIIISGEEKPIPANIGVNAVCMSEVHTHDGTGVIHVESVQAGKTFTVGDFFTVWGKVFNKNQIFDYVNGAEGQVIMFVNGKTNTDFENYIMKDHDQIEIRFE